MDGRITKEDAKKIGEIRKAGLGPVSSDIEKLAIEKEKHLLKVAEIEKELQNKSRTPPSKVEVINQKEIQKVEGKTLSKIENWPDIFKVAGEVVAKVAFPAIQKVTGEVTAKVANFPVIQKVVGVVDAKVTNLPEVQKVQVTNPTEKMFVTGEAKVTNLPLGKGKDRAGDPENFIGVRLTDGEHYYDISNFVTGGGAASGVGKTFVNSRGEKAYALLTDDNYLNVNVASGSTSGTEYTEGDTDASITGTAILWEDASNTLRSVSSAKPLPVSGDFYQETQPISGSVTVSSTDLDIRSLTNTSDSVAIYGSDDGGTTKRIIKTDSGGAIQVDLEVASVTVDNESIAVTGTFWQETQPISGTVAVSNESFPVTGTFWQETQPVSGTVTANAGTNLNTSSLLTESVFTGRLGEVQASPTSNTVLARLKTIADNQLADDHNVTVSNETIAVTGDFYQETQPVSGTVTVSGQVTANLGTINGVATETTQATLLTESDFDTRIGEVQASPTANTVLARLKDINDSQLADDHNVTVSNASIAVTGTFFQETQPISGSVTVSATDLDVRDLSSASDSVLAVVSDGTDTAAVIAAASDSDPDLDGQNLLATHALLSARKDADTTVGLTAEDSTHNALHVAISDGEGIANINASNQLEVAVGNTVTVDLGENNDVTVTGTVTANLGSTDNAVLDNIALYNQGSETALEKIDGAIVGPGEPTIDSYANAAISASADTANQSLIATPGANKQIWVYGIQFTVGTGDGTVSFQDEDDTAVSGVMEFSQTSGMSSPATGNFAMPMWKVATNKALEVDTVTCDIKGSIQYAIVSV